MLESPLIVISPEKAEEFMKRKADPKIKEMHLKRAETLRLQRERMQIKRLKEEINGCLDAMTVEGLQNTLSYMQYLLYLQNKPKNSD